MRRSLSLFLVSFLTAVLLGINIPAALADQGSVDIPLDSGSVKLVKPIDIVESDMFRDGGTMYAVLKDSNGKSFPFCLDGRIQEVTVEEFEKGVKSKPRHIFVGATHPASAGAQEIPVDGKEEKILLGILEDWVREHLSGEEQKEILGDHGMHGIPPQQRIALRVLQLISDIKGRLQ